MNGNPFWIHVVKHRSFELFLGVWPLPSTKGGSFWLATLPVGSLSTWEPTCTDLSSTGDDASILVVENCRFSDCRKRGMLNLSVKKYQNCQFLKFCAVLFPIRVTVCWERWLNRPSLEAVPPLMNSILWGMGISRIPSLCCWQLSKLGRARLARVFLQCLLATENLTSSATPSWNMIVWGLPNTEFDSPKHPQIHCHTLHAYVCKSCM